MCRAAALWFTPCVVCSSEGGRLRWMLGEVRGHCGFDASGGPSRVQSLSQHRFGVTRPSGGHGPEAAEQSSLDGCTRHTTALHTLIVAPHRTHHTPTHVPARPIQQPPPWWIPNSPAEKCRCVRDT